MFKYPLKLLMAYPYLDGQTLARLAERQDEIQFVVDSGAFTAWKAHKPIALDAYCNFIERLPLKPWKYFALDVVGDPHGTLKNYELMLKRGFKPIPIFTRGEDPSVMDDYYKTSDVVGIGGLVGTEGNKGFVKGIMKKVAGRKCHWLGFTSLPFVKVYKPFMCDSSTWEMAARFATCPLYLGRGKPIIQIKKDTVREQMKNPEILQAISNLGFSANDFMKDDNWNGVRSITRRLGGQSMRYLSEDVYTNLKTNMFLAAATKYAFELLLEKS